MEEPSGHAHVAWLHSRPCRLWLGGVRGVVAARSRGRRRADAGGVQWRHGSRRRAAATGGSPSAVVGTGAAARVAPLVTDAQASRALPALLPGRAGRPPLCLAAVGVSSMAGASRWSGIRRRGFLRDGLADAARRPAGGGRAADRRSRRQAELGDWRG